MCVVLAYIVRLSDLSVGNLLNLGSRGKWCGVLDVRAGDVALIARALCVLWERMGRLEVPLDQCQVDQYATCCDIASESL